MNVDASCYCGGKKLREYPGMGDASSVYILGETSSGKTDDNDGWFENLKEYYTKTFLAHPRAPRAESERNLRRPFIRTIHSPTL